MAITGHRSPTRAAGRLLRSSCTVAVGFLLDKHVDPRYT